MTKEGKGSDPERITQSLDIAADINVTAGKYNQEPGEEENESWEARLLFSLAGWRVKQEISNFC